MTSCSTWSSTSAATFCSHCFLTVELTLMACSHRQDSFVLSRPSFQFATISLFTSPTRTRQNCLVLSAVVFTPPTRQHKTVLSCPRRQCEHNWRRDKTFCPPKFLLVGDPKNLVYCSLLPWFTPTVWQSLVEFCSMMCMCEARQ